MMNPLSNISDILNIPTERRYQEMMNPLSNISDILNIPTERRYQEMMNPLSNISDILNIPTERRYQEMMNPFSNISDILNIPTERRYQEMMNPLSNISDILNIPTESSSQEMMSPLSNISDILDIPTESRDETINLDDSSSGSSTLSDSESSCGSENSLDASQDLSLSPNNSQLSSDEGSDPCIATIYKNKPLLFEDKTESFGILENFEKCRQRANMESECGIFVKEFRLMEETLSSIQTMAADTEKTILEKIDNFGATLQINNSFQGAISEQLDTLVSKVNAQTKIMSGLDKRTAKSGCLTEELDARMNSMNKNLKHLREEQKNERQMLDEVLKHLNTLVLADSIKPKSQQKMDNSSQTSPLMQLSVLSNIQENNLRDTKLGQKQVEATHQKQNHIIGKMKVTPKFRRRLKSHPFVHPQRRNSSVPDKNSALSIRHDKEGKFRTHCKESMNAVYRENNATKEGRYSLSPFNLFSQVCSIPEGLSGVAPLIETLYNSGEETVVPPIGFWQLFGTRDSEA